MAGCSKSINVERVLLQEGGIEGWVHITEMNDVLGVEAIQEAGTNEFVVIVSVAEFVREEPLESEFRSNIAEALMSVSGVSSVYEEDREVWIVEGSADGVVLI